MMGMLTCKDAYLFKEGPFAECLCDQNLWCHDIPPIKFLFVWRLAYDKIPTKVVVRSRGIFLGYSCYLFTPVKKVLNTYSSIAPLISLIGISSFGSSGFIQILTLWPIVSKFAKPFFPTNSILW